MGTQQGLLKLSAGEVVVVTGRDRMRDVIVKATYVVVADYSGPQRHTSDLEVDGILQRKRGHTEFHADDAADGVWQLNK